MKTQNLVLKAFNLLPMLNTKTDEDAKVVNAIAGTPFNLGIKLALIRV